jgi:hypothetical protein
VQEVRHTASEPRAEARSMNVSVSVSRGGKAAIQLQMRMLPPSWHEATLVPSGEKSTDATLLPAAVLSATSDSVDASAHSKHAHTGALACPP